MSLSPIPFVHADAQQIQTELITAYEQLTGVTLYPGDPRRVFLLQLLPVLMALKNDINYTGNQNLLAFAEDDALDALGERVGVPRLEEQMAKTTMRFTLSTIQLAAVTIPAGTRITPDGVLYFRTSAALVIPAGSTTGDVIALASAGGAKYNGLVAGQINQLVDPIPYVASVSNLDTSSGGADEEMDDAYRERQRLAPYSFSTAGPKEAYAFFAKSEDVNIVDVAVTSPSACVVNVYPLLTGGGIPDAAMLAKVNAAVSADNRRPLTDQVNVLAPTTVTYNINVTYYISSDRSAEVASIKAAIEAAGGAVDAYKQWQSAKLGRSVTPDDLMSRMYKAGAYRVVVTAPAYTTVQPNQVAKVGTTTVTYGGLI